jgi:PmbA protein
MSAPVGVAPADTAQRLIALMRAQGFDGAQVSVTRQRRSEVCVAHNEASLLRSTDTHRLQLVGLLDGRRAATDASEIGEEQLQATVRSLWDSVASAPQDEANAVSAGQHARIVRGRAQAELAELADATGALLAFREREAPSVMLEEMAVAHNSSWVSTLTSAGTDLACEIHWFDAGVFGLARDGTQASSFNYAGGNCDSLADAPLIARFGIDDLLQSLPKQTHTERIGERFVGGVVLTPKAMADLVGWLLGQLGDQALIDGSSVYRDAVGRLVASPLLNLRHRTDAPGVSPLTADAFVAAPVELIAQGRLRCLTPSLYGSRKTGLPHVALAMEGWDMAAGTTSRDALIAAVPRGALVDRLSMGRPAASGDFSGVIKNSFAIDHGRVGGALAETMISGNVAQMLRDVQAVSAERIDTGGWVLPWVRVDGLHFS